MKGSGQTIVGAAYPLGRAGGGGREEGLGMEVSGAITQTSQLL